MSTVKTTNLQNPSAASPNIVLGSTGSVAVAGAMTGAGMDLIAVSSIAYSGGSASVSGGAVTFSGVTSLSLNGCFTSAYENYRMTVTQFTGSLATTELRSRFRSSGTDNSSGNYYDQVIDVNGTGVAASRAVLVTYNRLGYGNDSGLSSVITDISSPQLPTTTPMFTNNCCSSGGPRTFVISQMQLQTTSFDGITIFPFSGTMTGTIRVYGYRNA